MNRCRAGDIHTYASGLRILLFVSALTGGLSPANGGVPNICARLLGHLTAENVGISQSAHSFVTLIDLALTHVSGGEREIYITHLEQMILSKVPFNPFLNVGSPIFQAFADRVELLEPMLRSEWEVIQSLVSRRLTGEDHKRHARTSNQHDNRKVEGPVRVQVPSDIVNIFTPRHGLSNIKYIGQTDQYFVFGSDPEGRGGGILFRMSKKDRTFETLATIPFPISRQHRARWLHNGMVYGFTSDGREFPETQGLLRIFRLDLNSKQAEFANLWDSGRNISYRVHVGNSVVGVQFQDLSLTTGSVFRFDYDAFEFVNTGLTFIVEDSPDPNRQARIGETVHALTNNDPPLNIGSSLMTDGRKLVPAGGSLDWRHWRINLWIQAFIKVEVPADNPTATMIYYTIHDLIEDPLDRTKTKLGSKPPLALTFRQVESNPDPPQMGCHSIEQGKSVLCTFGLNTPYMKFMIIDLDMWTMREVELQKVPVDGLKRYWTMIRNQNDQILLQSDVIEGDLGVHLWKLDPASATFEPQFSVTYPMAGGFGVTARVDYEDQSFVGWAQKDSLIVPSLLEMSRTQEPQ